jgi:hypothetical protein
LFLGTGLLYLVFASGLLAWGTGVREAIPAAWIGYLVLIVSGSHYGGTLLRVYEHETERRAYRLFTVYGTAIMLIVLVGALYSPIAGSLLITLYLTWSPWHYTGQNYGLAVMFLRRRGVEITPVAKRLLHASFVFSFLSVLITMHFEGGVGPKDPLGYRSLDIDKFQFISMGLPGSLRALLMPVVALGYVASVTAALTLLLRAGGARAVAPTALLMLTQAIWFSVPYLGSHFGLAAGIPILGEIGADSYQFYFVWVALGHAIQYLWITAYYARADQRWRGYGRYFTKVFVFGNAVWAAPVVLLGPDLLGRLDYGFGLAMCVAALRSIFTTSCSTAPSGSFAIPNWLPCSCVVGQSQSRRSRLRGVGHGGDVLPGLWRASSAWPGSFPMSSSIEDFPVPCSEANLRRRNRSSIAPRSTVVTPLSCAYNWPIDSPRPRIPGERFEITGAVWNSIPMPLVSPSSVSCRKSCWESMKPFSPGRRDWTNFQMTSICSAIRVPAC